MRYGLQKPKAPPSLPKFDSSWVIERKWDGMRACFELSSTGTKMFSFTGQDLLPQFPELHDLHLRVGGDCVLDGEILAFRPGTDQDDLELLQMRLGDKLARRRDEIPVSVRFFDILECQGADTRQMTLGHRLALLDNVLTGTEFSMPELLEGGEEIPSHWEGIVAKRLSSTYTSGGRPGDWVKWKFTLRTTLWCYGLTPGKGARASSFGALLVEDQDGVKRGQVGSGFTPSAIQSVMECDARHERFLIEVEYRFLSKTGLMVNTAFKGFRDDKVQADRFVDGLPVSE